VRFFRQGVQVEPVEQLPSSPAAVRALLVHLEVLVAMAGAIR
jgi:hypothetical protein